MAVRERIQSQSAQWDREASVPSTTRMAPLSLSSFSFLPLPTPLPHSNGDWLACNRDACASGFSPFTARAAAARETGGSAEEEQGAHAKTSAHAVHCGWAAWGTRAGPLDRERISVPVCASALFAVRSAQTCICVVISDTEPCPHPSMLPRVVAVA
jgi:hypothetical protein